MLTLLCRALAAFGEDEFERAPIESVCASVGG
jgi:hypothetical protein